MAVSFSLIVMKWEGQETASLEDMFSYSQQASMYKPQTHGNTVTIL